MPKPAPMTTLEIEALQTVAMVLAELIANAGLADKAAAAGIDRRGRTGRSGSTG